MVQMIEGSFSNEITGAGELISTNLYPYKIMKNFKDFGNVENFL